MRTQRNPVLKLSEAEMTRRRHGRVRCDQTQSTLGEVVDLSASGMRVVTRGRPLLPINCVAAVDLELDGTTLSLLARVVWMNKKGWRRYLVGLEFVYLTEDQQVALVRMAAVAANTEFIRDNLDPEAKSA